MFINNFLTNLTLDLGVYINDVMINIKQYFVSQFMICFSGFEIDNFDYDDKVMDFFLKLIKSVKYKKLTEKN